MQRKSNEGRLTVEPRSPDGFTIHGSLPVRHGPSRRVRVKSTRDSYAEACKEAALIEAEHYLKYWDAPQGGSPHFKLDAAIEKYLAEKTRSNRTKVGIARLREAIGADTLLTDIGQDTITKLREGLFNGRSEMTVLRDGITPLLAILGIAKKHRMLADLPHITKPEQVEGRTDFFLPAEAERLITHSAMHLAPLLEVFFCTGMRGAEGFYLDWREVRLNSAVIILNPDQTKGRKRRIIKLTPRAVATLASLQQAKPKVARNKKGEAWYPVFLTDTGEPYHDTEREYGGQASTAFNGALKRAGLLDPTRDLTVHTCRHSWASWHYALNRDPLRLMADGGWSSLKLVQRYAHLLDAGHEQEIRRFWGMPEPAQGDDAEPGIVVEIA